MVLSCLAMYPSNDVIACATTLPTMSSLSGRWCATPAAITSVSRRAQGPDLDVSPVAVFGRISRIKQHKANTLREVYRRHRCDSGEYDVLAALRRTGPPHSLTPTELSRSVLVNSGTMTERLTRLERRNLVRRTHSDHDRRSVSVALTADGQRLIDAAADDVLATEASLLRGLTEKDRNALEQLLTKLAADLDANP